MFTRYVRGVWILYVRRTRRVAGYSYKRRGRGGRRIRVRSYVVSFLQELARQKVKKPRLPRKPRPGRGLRPGRWQKAPTLPPKKIKRHAPPRREAPAPKVPGNWVSLKTYKRRLEVEYENLEWGRSDKFLPSFKWVKLDNVFMNRSKRFPPFPNYVPLAMVSMYFMVWDPSQEEHFVWGQNLKVGLAAPVFSLPRGVGFASFSWAASHIEEQAERQMEALMGAPERDSQGYEVRGLIGWGVLRG